MASGIVWWGTGASIFRSLKNRPSPRFRTQRQTHTLWMEGEKREQILGGWSAQCQSTLLRKVFACQTFQCEPTRPHIPGRPLSPSWLHLGCCHPVAETRLKSQPHSLHIQWPWLSHAAFLFFSVSTALPGALIQESAVIQHPRWRFWGPLGLLGVRKLA